MAVSDDNLPARKRRPSAGAFISPSISDQKLVQLLVHLSQEISSLQPTKILLKKTSASVIRKSRLVSMLLEELLRLNPVKKFPSSATLCFEELYIVLQRVKALLEDCRSCSRMWLLTQVPAIADSFHQLIGEVSTLLDIFPAREMKLSEDVIEFFDLIRKQCLTMSFADVTDENLRREVLDVLDEIKREIVPDQKILSVIFEKLGLNDSTSCTDEIESLEDEVRSQNDDESKASAVALIGLVRYAKCVLYGDESTSRVSTKINHRRTTSFEANVPSDYRCPISLELMRDPVVVATGQTYDRSSITLWIESGHNTCPKTGQTLAHTQMIPNLALKNLIAMWCRDHRIPFESPELTNAGTNHPIPNKTALEAVKMTVTFLVTKLSSFSLSSSSDDVDRVVHELRVLAKTDSDSRNFIGEAGTFPLLLNFLGSDNPSLQVNSITTILNLSILEANKKQIMETEGVLNGIVGVLKSGTTWEAKGNAAATIFSLSGVHAYRKRLGRKTRVVTSLVELTRDGPTSAKRDAMMAILNLAGDREAVARLIEVGVIGLAGEAMDVLVEEAAAVVEVVVKRGGLPAVAAVYRHGTVVGKLAEVLRDGSDRARESAAATLVSVCRHGGAEIVAQVAAVAGIERVVWEVMGTGTGRARRKAATLLRILRRWAAGLIVGGGGGGGDSTTTTTSVNIVSSTRIVLPA